MDFELRVVRGRSATEALKLADGVTSIGRQDDCTIRIKSSSVSRKHCEVFEKKGILLVKDLGSSNGTLVNGKKISGQQVVEPGDELTIGGIKLQVAKIGVAPPPAAKPAAKASAPAVAKPNDDDFDIDFNDLPESVATPEEEEEVVPDVDGFEIQLDEDMESPAPPPKPKAAPAPATAKAAKPAEKKAPEPAPAAEPDGADEAIADFLLDLKLDDD